MLNTKKTPEQIDLDSRVRAFNDELVPLLGKYKVGIGAAPIILSNGTLSAQPIIVDDSKREKKDSKVPAVPSVGGAEAKPPAGTPSPKPTDVPKEDKLTAA